MLPLLALAGLLASPSAGADPGLPPCACTCAPELYDPTTEAAIARAYEQAGAVFVGRVVAHNQYRPSLDPDGDGPIPPPPGGGSNTPHFFVVQESFKGPRQRLFGAFNDPQCGLGRLAVGTELLIYALGQERGGWQLYGLSMCTRSRPVEDQETFGSLEAEVAVLRRLAAAEND